MSQAEDRIMTGLPEPYQDLNMLSRPPAWSMAEHDHDYYQFIFVTQGILRLQCQERIYTLETGELCIIPPRQLHALHTEAGYSQLGINFTEQEDQRGMVALLKMHLPDLYIRNRPDLLVRLEAIEAECRELGKLAQLRLVVLLDDLVLSCLSEATDTDFKEQMVKLLMQAEDRGEVDLTQISKALNVSVSHLERASKKTFGCSVMELYHRMRADKARALLVNSRLTISEIAFALGFYDPAHFSRFFKARTSFSPSQYRSGKSKDLF